jgi:uncharacterized membrane protein
MLDFIVLYVHVLAAAAWIGGSILLFGMGIYFKDKQTQQTIYNHIGPFYGYFETIWLSLLLITGTYLFIQNDLYEILQSDIHLASLLWYKIIFVALIVISTTIHMIISLKAHKRERSFKEKLVSRATSMSIFLLNLAILKVAIEIREII